MADTPVAVPEKESLFQRVADYVSAAMGRPANIMIWLVAVVAWTLVFALGGTHVASGSWLPAWFTSLGFNFPLNLVTTVAELFIGFLVAAASNRSERNLDLTLDSIAAQDATIEAMEERLSAALAENNALIKGIHELTAATHSHVTSPKHHGKR